FQLLGDHLLARLMVARDHARHRLAARVGAGDPHADRVADPEPPAARRVVDLDLRRTDSDEVARLPRPGEMLELLALEPAGPDLLERSVLLFATALVEVERPRPRRPFLAVVIAVRDDDSEAGEARLACVTLGDLPGERPLADAVRRAPAEDAVDPPAGADRLAVTRLEVRAADAPVGQAA